jgi:hypothetical protein
MTDLDNVVALQVTPVASVQGTLALELGSRVEVPEPQLRPGGSGLLDVVTIDLVQRRRFEQHAARIGAAIVEIVGGDRPVSQLLRWTTPEVYRDLGRRAQSWPVPLGGVPAPAASRRCVPSSSPPTPASSPSARPR